MQQFSHYGPVRNHLLGGDAPLFIIQIIREHIQLFFFFCFFPLLHPPSSTFAKSLLQKHSSTTNERGRTSQDGVLRNHGTSSVVGDGRGSARGGGGSSRGGR